MESHPNQLETLTQEALAQYEAGHIEAAEALLLRARVAAPDDPTVHYLLACLASDRNDHAAAAQFLGIALEQSPDFPEALILLGDTLLLLGAWSEAAACLSRLLALQPDLVESRNSLAIALHGLGDYAGAVREFKETLVRDPDHAAARLGLGQTLVLSRRDVEAVAILQTCVARWPESEAARIWLALAQTALGEVSEAIEGLRRGMTFAPEDLLDYVHAGESALAAGRAEEALTWFVRAAACNPQDASAFSALGLVFARLERLDVAEPCFRHAVTLAPERADLLSNLGAVVLQQGDREGLNWLRRAAQQDRADAAAWRNVAKAALLLGEYQEAVEACRALITLEPNDASVAYDLGYALCNIGSYEAAATAFRHALTLRPDYGAAYGGLSAQLTLLGRTEEAIRVCREALALTLPDEDVSDLHHHLYVALLQHGDFDAGWSAYETWRERSQFKARPFVAPRWDGKPMPGKTLLIYADHGFGDAIQFLRFVPRAAERSQARILLECQEELLSLVEASLSVDQLVVRRSLDVLPDAPFDAQIGLMSLCGALGCGPDALPGSDGYLRAAEAAVERWKQRLAGYPGLKIGLCWTGDPTNQFNAWRSCRLESFAPLATATDVTFFSLQIGHGAEQIADAPAEMRLVDLAPELFDFGETAAAMQNLDLVITIETATAHLAGALHVPTWVLLPTGAPWMWPRGRERTAWYTSLRLFWQSTPGDWEGVLQRMAEELPRT